MERQEALKDYDLRNYQKNQSRFIKISPDSLKKKI